MSLANSLREAKGGACPPFLRSYENTSKKVFLGHDPIFGEDVFDRTASLDAIYHGFKGVSAKGRVSAHNTDRYSNRGRSPLPDTEDVSAEIRLANKEKCDWNWDFHFKYLDRDGGDFTRLNPSGKPDLLGAVNLMDFFPGNSYKRSQTALACSRSFNKDKLQLSCNLQRDWTDYTKSAAVGVDDIQYDTALVNLSWFANSELTLGLGAGRTVTEMNAVTSAWYQWALSTISNDYVSHDDVVQFSLGYSFSPRTAFSADLLTTRGYSDGLVVPNRFTELEQRYDLEYRCSKDARVGLRYTDAQYGERVYSLENGRIRRLDLDYRISF